jgi:hypothetical protein
VRAAVRRVVATSVSKTRGENFLLLKIKLARLSRRRPIDTGPVPWVARTRREGTDEHAIGRLNSEMMAMIQAKLTLEALGQDFTTVFSSAGASVQRIMAGDLVERTFSEVSGITRVENLLDRRIDAIQKPRQIRIINGLGTTGAPLTFEQIVAGLQYMNRGEIAVLEAEAQAVEAALALAKGAKEEELLLTRDIVTQRLQFARSRPLPPALTPALIEDQREQFLS